MGNQAGIIIRNVKNELFHSAKRLILNEVKGIECLLMILMGHYRTFVLPEEMRYSFFTNYIGMSSANIALFFFMFFSGYGLSLKINSCKNLSQVWWNRMKKIYLPLLFTCCVMIVIYSFIPNPFTQDYADSFHLSSVFHAGKGGLVLSSL